MEVSGQLHAPARERTMVPTGKEAVWVPEPFWTWWLWEKFPAVKLKLSLGILFNWAPRQEGVLGSGGIAPLILRPRY